MPAKKENNFSIQKSTKGFPEALIYNGNVLPLRHVTENELLELRATEEPGFVYKLGSNLFYTQIDFCNRFLLTTFASVDHNCNNCHCVGNGCQKVSDLSKSRYEKIGETPIQALNSSKRIEKYPFIEEGFEAFNIELETLFVIKCTNNIPCDDENNTKLSPLYKKELVENLEEFYMSTLS